MKNSDSDDLRAFVPSCENPENLILLDALGESTPEQKAALIPHLQSNPALAAEHADFTLLASHLTMHNAAIPPLPPFLASSLPASFRVTPPVRVQPWYRSRLVPLAAAAVILIGAVSWWQAVLRTTPGGLVSSTPSPTFPPETPLSFTNGGPSVSPAQAGDDKGAPRNPGLPSVVSSGGRKRAVISAAECVTKDGQRRSPDAVKIRGADARRFRSLLIESYGFKAEDIVTLVNEEATSDRIVGAINTHLIAQTLPGDVAVFFFSGHGTTVQDFDGDEDDGVDEAICPWDHDWQKVESWITDDIIGNMVNRMGHANVLVVADVCHAGTMTRGIDEDEGGVAPMGLDSGFRPIPRATPPVQPPTSGTTTPPVPRTTVPPPKREGYLKPEPLLEQKYFPKAERPAPAPFVPGKPNFRTDFTQEDADFIRQADDLIRQRQSSLGVWAPKTKGTLDLEPLFEQKWFPLQQDQFRQRLTPLPNADAVDAAILKLIEKREKGPVGTFKNEDWEVMKAAHEFMRLKNTFEPQAVEMMAKFLALGQAVITQHPITQPQGAQVLVAATTADRLSWTSYADGSHFLGALVPALKEASNSTTFTDVIRSITPAVQEKAKDAAQKWRNDQKKSAESLEYQQLPQAEGAAEAPVRAFMEGFTVTAPPPSPGAPPPPPPPPPAPPAPIRPVWQKQSGDIALNLSSDKSIYTEGDLMTVTLTPDLDCHLRLYYLSADHKVHQIFPNQYQTEGFVKKGQAVSLPGPGATFEFRMSAPFGNEILMAVASSVPFTDQAGDDLKTALFQEFKDTDLESLAHRGITVGEKKALTGRALHLYRVEAKK